MMFRLVNFIGDVEKYKLFQGEPCLVSTDNEIIYREVSAKLFKQPLSGFEIFGDKIFVNDWSGNYKIFDSQLSLLDAGTGRAFGQPSKYCLPFQSVGNDGRVIESLLTNNNQTITIGEIQKFNDLNYSDDKIYVVIHQNKTTLCAYSTPDAQLLWQFELKEIDISQSVSKQGSQHEVRYFITVNIDELVIQVTNATFLFLDIKTGGIRNIITLNQSHPLQSPVFL